MGHARALLSLGSAGRAAPAAGGDPRALLVGARDGGRRAERSARSCLGASARRSPELTALEDSLREALATRVRLVGNERQGRIEIIYASRDDLDRLTEILTARPR